MKITSTFKIRRYWLKDDTPKDVLATLNWKEGTFENKAVAYVTVNYHGESDRDITVMELRYSDWILARELLTYNVEGDDGLDL